MTQTCAGWGGLGFGFAHVHRSLMEDTLELAGYGLCGMWHPLSAAPQCQPAG
jgi:hypothetical protein